MFDIFQLRVLFGYLEQIARGVSLMLQNAKTSQYAWNISPVENKDVSQSLTAVIIEFSFPLDIELSTTTELNDESKSTLYNYLRNVSSDAD